VRRVWLGWPHTTPLHWSTHRPRIGPADRGHGVAQATAGNFRLLQRLFAQIHRIMKINELHTLTADVVETARSTLVIGAT
jgi:hypothetical protein